jgi:hypothetical protein
VKGDNDNMKPWGIPVGLIWLALLTGSWTAFAAFLWYIFFPWFFG